MSFLCFNNSLVVNGLSNLCFLELLRKRLIQLNTLNILQSENSHNSLSNMSSEVNVVLRISLLFFFSISDSSLFSTFSFSGHCVWSWSYLEPSHHLSSSLHIWKPLFPRSAGFSFEGAYFHSINVFSLILHTLLLTNV